MLINNMQMNLDDFQIFTKIHTAMDEQQNHIYGNWHLLRALNQDNEE